MASRNRNNNRRYTGQFRGIQMIFNDGYDAFWRGHLLNPYRAGTMKHKEWLRGQNAAYFDNLKYLENAA